MKRFYKNVSVEKEDKYYKIALDNKFVKTPFMNLLLLPNKNIAQAIAEEWENQGEDLKIKSMPLTNIAYTWQDKVVSNKDEIIKTIAPYLETELICYITPDNDELYQKQQELWLPIIEDFYQKTKIKLKQKSDIVSTAQGKEDMERFSEILNLMPSYELTSMQIAVSLLGSAVIAYLFTIALISADKAYDAALLEEIYQAEKWGLDPAIENKHEIIKQELENLEKFLNLTRGVCS